jgi:rSAM/selenodomain-associated transferase 1
MRNAAADQLIVFVKAPRPGFVKTRLAAALGPDEAAAAYRALAERLFAHLAGLTEVELRYTPDEALYEIQPWLRDGWRAQPQGAGDLGERLTRATEHAFVAAARRVAVIGSDCPDVSEADVRAAWLALAENDVALGPASDGGYWLVALREPQPGLFARMPWSTDEVLATTLERAEALGLKVALLRTLSDVDTAEDWERFRARDRAAGFTSSAP